jgi:class 3 adenylate cyclase
MKRRSKAGAKSKKARRRGTVALKRGNASKMPRSRSSSADDKDKEIALLTRERDEVLEQQKASADILSVISNSVTDTQPVFDKILESCKHLFGGDELDVLLVDEQGQLNIAAYIGEAHDVVAATFPAPVERTPAGRAIRERRVMHWPDLVNGEDVPGVLRKMAKLIGYRSMVFAPMLWEGRGIGAIGVARSTGPFNPKELAMLQTFADQAVIAIQNARLFNETKEALEQQAATSEVLSIISSSPGELEPVFQAMLENAVRICDAKFGTLYRYESETFAAVALFGTPPAYAEFQRQRGQFQPPAGTALDRILQTKELVSIADVATSGDASGGPTAGAAARFGGARSLIAAPMVKENMLIGAIVIYRQEVRPFTDKQIALVANFAAQAVIAIENTRLLNELNELNQQLERRVADQVGEIERTGRLRRFLPPQVADLIVASGTEKQLESHRGEITALFCDLRGFTGFSESSDPEDVMALLHEYHAAIGEIIIKYSGTLERYAGDGVMVIFNDPVPVPDPALQAVKMALDMRVSIGALIENWRRLGHDLGFGMGIAHGFATLGTIGFEGRFDYAAIGTVSNVASRLCDEAKPGQILISPRVLMAVDKDVTVEAVGEFTLKGIRRPMATYNVLAAAVSKNSDE